MILLTHKTLFKLNTEYPTYTITLDHHSWTKTKIGTTFQYKWQGRVYAHPHTEKEAQQTLHWAWLTSKNNLDTVTILVIPDENCYHNLKPHEGSFLDSHVITHFKADTIIYEEPTIPPELRIKPRTEGRAIYILCTHHKGTPIGS